MLLFFLKRSFLWRKTESAKKSLLHTKHDSIESSMREKMWKSIKYSEWYEKHFKFKFSNKVIARGSKSTWSQSAELLAFFFSTSSNCFENEVILIRFRDRNSHSIKHMVWCFVWLVRYNNVCVGDVLNSSQLNAKKMSEDSKAVAIEACLVAL